MDAKPRTSQDFPRTDRVRSLSVAARVRSTRPIVRIERRLKPGQRLAELGPLLVKAEVADKIKKSVSWVEKAYASGDLVQPLYVGKSAVWPQTWIDDWLQAQVEDQVEQRTDAT